jgi:hypothetical protein
MRRFARFVCLGFGAAGALAWAGCTPTGHYQVSWNFFPRADGTGDPQGAGNGCGLHGVDAIFIQGTSGGNGATEIWLCTPGQFTGTVATGDWTFLIAQMDARGTIVGDADGGAPGRAVSTTTMTVTQGGTAVFPTVTLTPRPECQDGVDNDGDGLIDGDDPGCANADPNNPQDLTLESSAGPGTLLDAGLFDAGGTPDGGGTSDAGGGTPDGMAPDAPVDGRDLDGAAPDASQADAGVPADAAAGG